MKKKLILPSFLALAILAVGILATKVKAEEGKYYPPIVQKIADKFNLDVTDVENVFDEDRDERRADMYARFAERLNDLVAEGKLTEEQKNALLDKHEEMQNELEGLKDLSPQERKDKMQQIHTDFESWLKEQNIDISSFALFHEGFGGHFHHGYMMWGN